MLALRGMQCNKTAFLCKQQLVLVRNKCRNALSKMYKSWIKCIRSLEVGGKNETFEVPQMTLPNNFQIVCFSYAPILESERDGSIFAMKF